MEKLLMDGQARLINADSLVYIKTLPDASIDLIATDPPYFGVKALDWDNQWKSEQEFLAWLEQFVVTTVHLFRIQRSWHLPVHSAIILIMSIHSFHMRQAARRFRLSLILLPDSYRVHGLHFRQESS